jgi:hypothetical protein
MEKRPTKIGADRLRLLLPKAPIFLLRHETTRKNDVCRRFNVALGFSPRRKKRTQGTTASLGQGSGSALCHLACGRMGQETREGHGRLKKQCKSHIFFLNTHQASFSSQRNGCLARCIYFSVIRERLASMLHDGWRDWLHPAPRYILIHSSGQSRYTTNQHKSRALEN